MNVATIAYDRAADGIVTLAWDDPARTVNLLTSASVAEFAAAVERVLADDLAVGAIVLSRKRDFIGGLDLTTIGPAGVASVRDTVDAVDAFRRATRRMETGGKPFVAVLHGSALGGGAELALGAHRRIAANDVARARFGFPEVTLGLLPGGGGTQRVPRLCGVVAALPLLLEGRPLRFSDAHARGLIDELAPTAETTRNARAWILANPAPVAPWDESGFRMPHGAAGSPAVVDAFASANAKLREKTSGNYPAPVAILSAIYEGTQLDIDRGLRVEGRYFASLARGREARAMVGTLFFALRRANDRARRADGVAPATFAHVGVIGAGMMGAGIARVAAQSGARVTLLDRDLPTAQDGAARANAALGAHPRATVTATTAYADLADCDLAIEAVFEDRAIKADVTARAEAEMPSRAVFASNTSTLPITGLARASVRPERFIGLHFFSPVERMPLVEIIRGAATGDEALAIALDFVRAIGKTPIVVNDSRGFFTSRVFAAYVHEGLAMLREGVPAALVENAGRLAGMAVGPLAVADDVSFSLLYHVVTQTRADLGSGYVPGPADDVIELFARVLDRPGKAAGRGIYVYPEGEKKRLWAGLAEALGAPRRPAFDRATIGDRLLYVQVAEARRALAEGVLTDPAMGDVASILGWGFPAFTGGVFAFATYVGEAAYLARARELAQRFGPRFDPGATIAVPTPREPIC